MENVQRDIIAMNSTTASLVQPTIRTLGRCLHVSYQLNVVPQDYALMGFAVVALFLLSLPNARSRLIVVPLLCALMDAAQVDGLV
jgi:hypothetical protein